MNLKQSNIYHIIIFLFLSIFSAANIARGELVLQYDFENGAIDTTCNGYDGTLTGSTKIAYDVERDSNVLVCDGNVGNLIVPAEAFSTIDKQITISLWQNGNPDLEPKKSSIFWATNSSGKRLLNAHLPWTDENIYFDAGYTTSWDRIYKTATFEDYEGIWNNWVFTKDANEGTMKIYLNGELWFSGAGKTKSMTGIVSCFIGWGIEGYYAGSIDDFRIYNNCMTDFEVQQLYSGLSNYKAYGPSPKDKTENIAIDSAVQLQWTVENPVDSHRIYFSIANPPGLLIRDLPDSSSKTETFTLPMQLQPNKTWYWRVDTVRNDGNDVEVGDVWSFNTNVPPVVNTGLPFDEIVFVKRKPYSSNHYYTEINNGTNSSRFLAENGIYIYNVKTEQERPVITAADIPGSGNGVIGLMSLSFDAKKVIFDYRQSVSGAFRIWECNVDGTGLRQITFEPPDEAQKAARYGEAGYHTNDIHPCYLPDGNIMFTSSRCEHSILCASNGKLSSVVLHRMNPNDPNSIEQLTRSPVSEFCPVVLDDGKILYHRWEYVDKGHRTPKTLWVMNPDGTKSQELFGLDKDSTTVFTYARPLPGDPTKLVCVGTCHYPQGGAVGSIMLVDLKKDPRTGHHDPTAPGYQQWDERYAVVNITDDVFVEKHTQPGWRFKQANGTYVQNESGTAGHLYTHPFPVTDKTFLVSYKMNASDHYQNVPGAYGIYLLDTQNNCTLIYKDPDGTVSCWHPTPLVARKVPPIIYSFRNATLKAQNKALCMLTNIYEGMEGVKKGDVKWLRINEAFQRPWASLKYSLWGTDLASQSWAGALWPRVQWGIVPVEEDGSAQFYVTADRNIFLQALDSDFREIQRERTYINYRPGEYRSCLGCHERTGRAPAPIATEAPIAMRRAPSEPGPMPGETDPHQIIDFGNDIQPILNAKCVSCHDASNTTLNLSGTYTLHYNEAFQQLLDKREAGPLISELNGNVNGTYLPPKSLGSYKSKLVNKLLNKDDPHSARVTDLERLQIIRWVDSNYQFYPCYYGRWNNTYSSHPNFRVEPTFDEAISMFAPPWHK